MRLKRGQCSLLTFLVLISCISVVSGWTGRRVNQLVYELRAAARIQEQGGTVTWSGILGRDKYRTQPQIGGVRLAGRVNLNTLKLVAGIQDLRRLTLYDMHLTRPALQTLTRLKNLRQLDLSRCTFEGECLDEVARLPGLEVLVLNDTDATDETLADLHGLSSLQLLHLDRTLVTDEGLKHLRRFTELESLSLFETAVTDQGLSFLKQLPRLEFVAVGDASATLDASDVEPFADE